MYKQTYFYGKLVGFSYEKILEDGNSIIVSFLKDESSPEYQKFKEWHKEHPEFDVEDKPTSPSDEIAQLRKNEYYEQSCTPDELIVALWEYVVENRPAAMNELQEKRLAVKQKYPKS